MKPRYIITEDGRYVNVINRIEMKPKNLGHRISMKYRSSATNSRTKPNLISPRLSMTIINHTGLKGIGNRNSQRK